MLSLTYENLQSACDYFFLGINLAIGHLHTYLLCMEKSLTILTTFLVLYGIICISIYLNNYNVPYSNNLRGTLSTKERILIIISHPDDECMFFGPSIVNLTRCKNKDVYLLCLSYGDYYGRGKHRKEELWKSCSILGIPESNIFLQKISSLLDNPKVIWDENVICNLIINYVETLHFDAVLTFDKDGVSGHLNHKAVYFSLAQTVANNQFPSYCSIYCLDSVNKLRKFSLIFDILLAICFSSNRAILSPSECYLVKEALRAHQTQYIWFRKLFICISRYAYINTFSVLSANDARFDINFRDICI